MRAAWRSGSLNAQSQSRDLPWRGHRDVDWRKPFVEGTADRVPEKCMGAFGVALMLIGFTLQSAQYWATLFDVKVRYVHVPRTIAVPVWDG